jgi:hypothetical protein
MTIAEYAKKQGIKTLPEYEKLRDNIKAIAKGTYDYLCSMYKMDTGLYHPIGEILPIRHDTDIDRYYIILEELKPLGVEFYHDKDGLMFRI